MNNILQFGPFTPAGSQAEQVVSPIEHPYDPRMSTPTREEIDAKLELGQVRMDARAAAIEGKIDTLAAQITGQMQSMTLLSERAVAAAEGAAAAAASAASAADRAGGIKQTLWITSITTVLSVLAIALAAYFGTQQSNIGIVQGTIAAFEAGRSAAPSAAPAAPAAPTSKDGRKQ